MFNRLVVLNIICYVASSNVSGKMLEFLFILSFFNDQWAKCFQPESHESINHLTPSHSPKMRGE
jgi:hypothetical protein